MTAADFTQMLSDGGNDGTEDWEMKGPPAEDKSCCLNSNALVALYIKG